MVVKIAPAAQLDSFADLHARLGYVPLDRICMDPPPGRATEADVLRYQEAADKRLYELIDGTLVEKAMGTHESFLGMELGRLIGNFVREHRLGIVVGADGPFRLFEGNVRYPDVSFIPFSRLPEVGMPNEAIWRTIPTLVVEVLSPSNTVQEIDRKLHDYFAGGCRLAWVIDPITRTAEVYTSVKKRKVVQRDGSLDGGRVLPGFHLPLVQLFADPPRPKSKKKS
jgi:Uma2 family endonuclease